VSPEELEAVREFGEAKIAKPSLRGVPR